MASDVLKRIGWPTLIVGGAALAILLAAWLLPLTTEERTAVGLGHATEMMVLSPGQSIEQHFTAEGGYASGVVVYSTAVLLRGRELEARILDPRGKEVAHSTGSIHTSYFFDNDQLRLEIPTTWFKTQPKERLTLRLTLTRGPTFQLLIVKGARDRHDIALGILYPAQLSFGAQEGVLAGLFVMVAVLGMTLFVPARWQWWTAAGLLIAVSFLGLAGFWFSSASLGIADWDYYFSLHEVYRQTILHFHQLPLWNPYTCGGTAALGDPEFPLFTPTFLLELIFGIPAGLRLAIYFSIATSGLGMLVLAKRLRLSVLAGILAALGYMFTTVKLLEMVEGHVNIFAAMWLPWFWWAWLGAYRSVPMPSLKQWWRYVLPAPRLLLVSFFLALIFMQGGIYLLVYTLLALAMVVVLSPQKLKALWVTLLSGLWALSVIAIKLFPVLLWLKQFPHQTFATSTFTGPWLEDIFFGRYLHGVYIIFEQSSGWHEYSAYIGAILFAISLLALTQIHKRRVVAVLVVGGVAALMLSMLGQALQPAYNILWFIPRSNISRIVVLTVIAVVLLAGFGLDEVRKKIPAVWLPVLLIGLVAVDLISLAYQASEQAFILPPVYPLITPAPSPIAYTAHTFDYQARDIHQTRTYEATRNGWGTFFHCSVLGPVSMAIPIESEDDSRIVTAVPDTTPFHLVEWTPNHLTVDVQASTPTTIALNNTWVQGWQVNGRPADNYSGRVAANIPAGTYRLQFVYTAPGFRPGLAVSIVALVVIGLILAPGVSGSLRKRRAARDATTDTGRAPQRPPS